MAGSSSNKGVIGKRTNERKERLLRLRRNRHKHAPPERIVRQAQDEIVVEKRAADKAVRRAEKHQRSAKRRDHKITLIVSKAALFDIATRQSHQSVDLDPNVDFDERRAWWLKRLSLAFNYVLIAEAAIVIPKSE